MAIKTFYFLNTKVAGQNFLDVQDGGTAPTSANASSGWTNGTVASGNFSKLAALVVRATGTFSATSAPAAPADSTLGDCYRTGLLSGTFDAGIWTIGLALVGSQTNGVVRARFRIFKSANADGSSETDPGFGVQDGGSYTVTTTAGQSSVSTASLPAFTLNNEYLFIQVALSTVTAGSTSTRTVTIRLDALSRVITPNFNPVTSRIKEVVRPKVKNRLRRKNRRLRTLLLTGLVATQPTTNGTISASLPTFTLAASGTAVDQPAIHKDFVVTRVKRPQRQGAVTLQGLTYGSNEDVASLSFSLPTFTFASAATLPITGTVAFNLPTFGFFSDASVITEAIGGVQLVARKPPPLFRGNVTLRKVSFTQINSDGTIAFTLPSFTTSTQGISSKPNQSNINIIKYKPHVKLRGHVLRLYAAGITANTGTITATLPSFTIASSGLVNDQVVAFSLPTFVFSSTGVVSKPYRSGVKLVRYKPLVKFKGRVISLRSSGQAVTTGTISANLPTFTFAASSDVVITGTLSASLTKFTFASSGNVDVTGTIAGTLPTFTFTSSGSVPVSGTISTSVPTFVFASSGTVDITGTINTSVPKFTLAISTTTDITGVVTFSVPKFTFVSSGSVSITGTIAFSLPTFELDAFEQATDVGSVTTTLPMMTVSIRGTLFDRDGSVIGTGPTIGQLFPT